MIKTGISGANGRMGQFLTSLIQESPDFHLAGGLDKTPPEKNGFPFFETGDKFFQNVDLVIDFSAPDVSVANAALAAKYRKPLLIGTTGLTNAQVEEIKTSAVKAPILLSANTSLGVNLLIQLTRKVAAILGEDYAIEILEAHHKNKVDAPSGTALALGKAAAEGRGVDFDTNKSTERNGARKVEDIGFAVMRGGDCIGEHTVYFYGEGERLELTHRATDRKLFAKGALAAARWLHTQKSGFYTMDDFIQFL